MKPLHADAKNVGAHLDSPDSPLHGLLKRARGLDELQQILCEWAQAPLSHSLRIVNERDGVVVVYADTAPAFTELRYRQQELLHLLRLRLKQKDLTIEIKLRPAAQSG